MRRFILLLAAAVSLTGSPAWAGVPTLSWNNGPLTFVSENNYDTGISESYATAQVSFDSDQVSQPHAWRPFYARIIVTILTADFGVNQAVTPKTLLPAGFTLAISEAYPVRAFVYPKGGAAATDNEQPCAQGAFMIADFFYFANSRNAAFSVSYNHTLEVWFPLRSENPVSDVVITTSSAISLSQSHTAVDAVATVEHVAVYAVTAPVFQVPEKAVTDLTSSSAHLTASIHADSVPGTAYLDLGTTLAYGTSTVIRTLDSSSDDFPLEADATGLQEMTTYHWRIRFVESNGATYTSDDQTFITWANPYRPVAWDAGTPAPAAPDAGTVSVPVVTPTTPAASTDTETPAAHGCSAAPLGMDGFALMVAALSGAVATRRRLRRHA